MSDRVVTFQALVGKSIDHAEAAEGFLEKPGEIGSIDREEAPVAAMVHATLAEAYARLASALIVNRTSLHVAAGEPPPTSRPT